MENVPGYFSWFGVEQILWLCSKVINFFYDLVPNVGWAVILFAFFTHILFLPFSIKNGIDRKKESKIKSKIFELQEEFNLLSEEERNKEEVKEKFRERRKKIEREKPSTGLGCIVMLLRLFVLISAIPVISYMEHFVGSPLDYNFFGLNLLEVPIENISFSLILPFLTSFILTIPGVLSVRKNLKENKEAREKKTKEEREEEERMLREMGIKQSKIPAGYIIQLVFGILYFYTFSNVKLVLSLYWCVFYLINFFMRRIVDFGFSKVTE